MAVDRILKNGFNPYENSKFEEIEKHYNIKETFQFSLDIKKIFFQKVVIPIFELELQSFKNGLKTMDLISY
ncbi:hypothetical protein LXD69_09680 [Flavobacterium sediminilitoris]|uniref:Uncharacterized protein n=1 Tax=Flavobacterium sediminilitoris TaxID=2024526 RepID=A0ABY4HHK8_9FLAO|nr:MULTISPECIES: hypothetical protein [Flavobacterium]UOX32322.1 hypothetical protein LXD69_09680 [Flavobacterium sediminilitoris]